MNNQAYFMSKSKYMDYNISIFYVTHTYIYMCVSFRMLIYTDYDVIMSEGG